MKYFISTKESKRNSNGFVPVNIVFRHGKREFTVATGIMVRNTFEGLAVPPTEPNGKMKMKRLMLITDKLDEFLLERGCAPVDFDTIKPKLKAIVSGKAEAPAKCLADYIDEYAEALGKKSTAALYANTAAKVRAFDARATFATVNADWLERFVRSCGKISTNYAAILLRNIRTVFNRAIDNEQTSCYPFRKFKIKTERTEINNITVEQLRLLRDYPLDDWRRIYRDLFMLSFYLCGINPVDLLSLKHTDMRNGRIRYKRRKTGRLYDIPVPQEAMEIISRYMGRKQLLCPLDTYADYRDFYHHWNDALKKMGPVTIVRDRAGKMRKHEWHPIVEGLTAYTARYTFASIGAELDIPRETIALCLGHSWADVTSHYIAYDMKKIDEAVRKIVDYVNGK